MIIHHLKLITRADGKHANIAAGDILKQMGIDVNQHMFVDGKYTGQTKHQIRTAILTDVLPVKGNLGARIKHANAGA